MREEWGSLLVFGGAFVAVLFVAIFSVEPAFFYSRLTSDPLLYYLKAITFATTGHSNARTAVNLPPFHWVGMPGFLRSPIILAFHDFDSQLRAMQVTNVALLFVTGAMYSYVLSWVVQERRRWMAIAFCFGFMLLSPIWVENAILPMADAPYAACTIATLILIVRIVASPAETSVAQWRMQIGLATALFLVAFLLKFTAPALLLMGMALLLGRVRGTGGSLRALAMAGGASALLLLALIAFNWPSISRKYLVELLLFVVYGNKPAMILNLLGYSLPSQILPIFNFAFSTPPFVHTYTPVFAATPGDDAVIVAGICVSAVILAGMWRGRRSFAPELIYLIVPLPVLTLMMPSTWRYLLAYQPIIWIFFILGLGQILGPRVSAIMRNRAIATAAGLIILVGGGTVAYFRMQRMSGTMANGMAGVPLSGAHDYTRTVSSEFRALRTFLDALPRDKTLLVSEWLTLGRWKVVTGLEYYSADETLAAVAKKKEPYLLVECSTIESCGDFQHFDKLMKRGVGGDQVFEFQRVFERQSPYARIIVYRLKPRLQAVATFGSGVDAVSTPTEP